jgi:hypothetical protein
LGKKLKNKKKINEKFPWLGYPKCVRENFSIDGRISLLFKIFVKRARE